ncbi:hypothetical protein QCD60_00685 [Pokkaliibacter sp. MBI-7]|uniref:hypothetical protein n=1 Tax=Pokkaliibacter sp. MBI-7 TaxID=3040600 RepID=UPI00244B06E6|nr:hypothetical protein [Pokkaliibacter sp. MBI-7]MDH2431069.1 hypothetical protein [Pokkaliibacter sp. MBI-7]
MKHRLGVLATLLIALWWYYLPSGPVCFVEIEFIAPDGTAPLSTAEILSGVDKATLANIQPGESQTARIYPGDASENEIVLFVNRYPTSTENNNWSGQRYYPPGTAFRTHIQIDQEGKVISEKSCQLPCSFD